MQILGQGRTTRIACRSAVFLSPSIEAPPGRTPRRRRPRRHWRAAISEIEDDDVLYRAGLAEQGALCVEVVGGGRRGLLHQVDLGQPHASETGRAEQRVALVE